MSEIDKILKGFHKTVSKLKKLTERNLQVIQYHVEEADHHATRRIELLAENDKAHGIIGNIEKLLGIHQPEQNP